jgi:DNA-binding transcriptional LysR family regulator
MPELDLNDVAAFVRVVEHTGFAKAARELGVPTSTVSRAVARLESATGTRLVHRNTRSVTPTSEGHAFYLEVAPAVLTLRHAARSVDGNQREVRGRLRISAPNDIGSTFVAGVVTAFAKENGTIQKLITDPTVYRNIDDAAASLARILARSEKITRDLEVFADKVARRPELIGIGGALRPSGGLKELPGAPSYRPDWPPASSARPFSGPNWLGPPDGPPPPVQGHKP